MNRNILAIVFQEGGRLVTELIRNRTPKRAVIIEHRPATVVEEPEEPFETAAREEEKAEEIATACVPCVPPNTLIWSNPNIQQIDNLNLNEKVISYDGQYTKISRIIRRHYTGDLISITIPYQNTPILLTPEHPVLAIEAVKCKRDKQTLCFPKENPKCDNCPFIKYEPKFVSAKDLSITGKTNKWSKHIVLMPRLSIIEDRDTLTVANIVKVTPPFIRNKVKRTIKVDEDFMKLAGYYLAEGSVNFRERGALLRFDFGINEEEYVNEVINLIYKVFSLRAKATAQNTTRRVYISSVILGHFFHNLFGSGARTKQIPDWLLLLPYKKQIPLLHSFWLGDGSFPISYNRQVMSASTTSLQLAYSLRLILHRLGVLHNLSLQKTKPSQIDGRTIKSGEDQYIIQINSNATAKLMKLFGLPVDYRFVQSSQVGIDDKWVYLPIKKIRKIPYTGTVMNLETESGTYCAQGIIVHNCAIGHYGTCSGLLNEAVRFAKKDGVGSSEVIDRMNMCLDELNTMERVDLRPELTAELPSWEKELADKALMESRKTRHDLEGLATVADLEKTAANLQTARNEIGREWFKKRLAKMPKEEKERLAERAIERLEEE